MDIECDPRLSEEIVATLDGSVEADKADNYWKGHAYPIVNPNSFVSFAESYLMVKHPEDGVIPLRILPYHQRLLDACEKYDYIIVKDIRHSQLVDVMIANLFWKCIYRTKQNIGIFCKTLREVGLLRTQIQRFIEHLPNSPSGFSPIGVESLKSKIGCSYPDASGTVCCLFDESRSKITIQNHSSKHEKSEYTDILVLDAAFNSSMGTNWNAINSQLKSGGKMLVVSLPNGQKNRLFRSTTCSKDNWFYTTYQNSFHEMDRFYNFQFTYTEIPYYTPERIEQLKMYSVNSPAGKNFQQDVLGVFYPEGLIATDNGFEIFPGAGIANECKLDVENCILDMDMPQFRTLSDVCGISSTADVDIDDSILVLAGLEQEESVDECIEDQAIEPFQKLQWSGDSDYMKTGLNEALCVPATEAKQEVVEIKKSRRRLMKKIMNVQRKLPDSINLTFEGEYLLINGVRTKISITDMEGTFAGLRPVMSKKKTYKFIQKLVCGQLKKLF